MRRPLVLCVVVVAFSWGTSSSRGQVIEMDHDVIIDETSSQPAVGVRVLDGLGGPSIVTVVDGGAVATDTNARSEILGSSTLALAGGIIGGPVEVHADGQFVLSAGTITISRFLEPAPESYITTTDSASLNITGGLIDHFADFIPQRFPVILARGDSQVSVRGGNLRSWIDHTIVARGRSQVNIEARFSDQMTSTCL